MPGKCVYNEKWRLDLKYKEWLEACAHDKHKVFCNVCKKEINIARMGETALKAHMAGQKHRSAIEVKKNGILMTDFLNKPSSSNSNNNNRSATIHLEDAGSKKIVSSYLVKKEVQSAEILWAIKCVMNHYSFNSCTGIEKLFVSMFPDSDIAKQFSCGEKKVAYMCRFGLAPYFQSVLVKNLEELKHFTLLFDETLNRSTQRKQMDIYVRFWHEQLNEVYTRYFTSQYMGHSTANDILSHFLESVKHLNLSKTIQISMDGPAVNWVFYNLLQKELKQRYGITALNVGSCGLHTLNNAFKNGNSVTEWNIYAFLTALYWLFKDSPARRDDFLKLAKIGKFPLKFVSHRWLENVPAAERALEIWTDLSDYVQRVNSGIIKMVNKPKSFYAVVDAINEPLMPAKINFFLSVAKLLLPFMTFYQNDAPVFPFFAADVLKIFQQCLTNFNILKQECLKCLNSCMKICKFDFSNSENYSPIIAVSCGFVADKILRDLQKSKKVNEKEIMSFKHDCQKFVLTMLSSIADKSPINYSIVRNIACLDPKRMANNPENCCLKMKKVLLELVAAKHVQEEKCEAILLQFNEFLNDEVKSAASSFSEYTPEKIKLDTFLAMYMAKKRYCDIWEIVKIILILSHGQATVERGFSINKNIQVENLVGESYIGLRTISDHVRHCGGADKVELTKELRASVSSARQAYMEHLERQRQSQVAVARKRVNEEELGLLLAKRRKLEKEVTHLKNSVDNLSVQAKTLRSVDLFIKCDDMRNDIKKTEKELDDVNSEISNKQHHLKNH